MGMPYYIIGDEETVLGFSFAGVQGIAVSTEDEARKAFRDAISNSELVVLIITEDVGNMLEAEVKEHRYAAKPPYVTVVESVRGPKGQRISLLDLIKEAVGVKISNDDGENE